MTTITITKEVAAALAGNKGDKRRQAMRELATNEFSKASITADKYVNAIQANDLVRDGIVNPRHTITGFRDQMTQPALFALITGFQTADETVSAVGLTLNKEHWGLTASPACATLLGELITAIASADENAIEQAVLAMGTENVDVTWWTDSNKEAIAFLKAHADGIVGEDTEETPAEQQSLAEKFVLPELPSTQVTTVNAVFGALGLPTYEVMRHSVASLNKELATAKTGPKGMNITFQFNGQPALAASGTLPAGKMETRKAKDIFDVGAAASQFDFDVPFFVWDAKHRDVPEIDKDYMFEPVSLMRALWAIIVGKNVWAYGDTGTGKSTLFEQICARLNYPLVRVNFDSDITRMELIGKDTLISTPNGTVTKFLDGVLPDALSRPCVLLCDEADAIRPDAAFIMQRMTEGNGLLIAEDGGRFVAPDPMFRIVATGNTKGSGDDSGRYMGARVQNGAFLDRFTTWIHVDYMKPAQLEKLIKAKAPNASSVAAKLAQYAKEHWIGFRQGDIQLPLSPRGVVAAAEAYSFYSGVLPKGEALHAAVRTTIADRATDADAQTINGLVQRVFK